MKIVLADDDSPLTQVTILTGYFNIDYLTNCFEAGATVFSQAFKKIPAHFPRGCPAGAGKGGSLAWRLCLAGRSRGGTYG